VAIPEGAAVKVTELPAQIISSASLLTRLTTGSGFTVVVMPELVLTQPAAVVMITSTILPVVSALVVYVFDAALTALTPFTRKSYVAAPAGKAVKVTEPPAQIVLSASLLESVALTAGFTVIVMPALVFAQPAAEVIVTLTTSPLFNVLVVYVLVPEVNAMAPFILKS
jgi:hypothetical protein